MRCDTQKEVSLSKQSSSRFAAFVTVVLEHLEAALKAIAVQNASGEIASNTFTNGPFFTQFMRQVFVDVG